MKNLTPKLLFMIAVAIFDFGCKVPYYPPVNSKPTNYLVVEGYITSDSPTVIKLTRTRVVSQFDTANSAAETHAHVVVEDDQKNIYPLTEDSNGIYSMKPVFLDSSARYRVRITLSQGKEYISDFVPFEESPKINGIDWQLKASGVQLYVKTHDRKNVSPYYRWIYHSTWEYHTPYTSGLIYDPASNTIGNRTLQVHQCWVADNSTKIILGSAIDERDNIIHSPLIFFPDHDRRLSVLYSVFVTQYLLDSSAYNFWTAIKNNNEDIGSIFDSQPNQTKGNVHCVTDSSEVVLGYIGAGNTTSFRAFINNDSLPASWNLPTGCTRLFVPKDSIEYYFPYGYVPLYETTQHSKEGYFSAEEECGDCTYLGSNVKPAFWP